MNRTAFARKEIGESVSQRDGTENIVTNVAPIATVIQPRFIGRPSRVNLIPVDGNQDAPGILYELLAERPERAWISHKAMPTREEHEAFVADHPFLRWYLIENAGVIVGSIEVTDRNEIGVAIFERYKRKGFAYLALTKFMATHTPLPAIPAVRNPHWLANIAADNEDGKDFFSRMGFSPLQETWVMP